MAVHSGHGLGIEFGTAQIQRCRSNSKPRSEPCKPPQRPIDRTMAFAEHRFANFQFLPNKAGKHMRGEREHKRRAAIWTSGSCFKVAMMCAAVAMVAATARESLAADPGKPLAGKQVRFPEGDWSALPQIGPEGRVRQCVLVARRSRTGRGGAIATDLSLTIGRGVRL